MTPIKPITLRRRELLRAGALLAGAATLGLETQGRAAATGDAVRPTTSLAFWDGIRFVNPHKSPADHSRTLSEAGARITLGGHHRPDASARAVLRAVIAHFAVPTNGGVQDVPFHAWVSVPHPTTHRTVFTMPAAGRCLNFSVALDTGQERHVLSGPGLRAGTYVFAAGTPLWAACRLDPGQGALSRRTLSGPRPADFEYLLMTVAPAA